MQAAQGMGFDEDGREVLVHETSGFRLHYFIARNGRVIFTELLAKPKVGG
jgi:hypothetical protein